MEIMKSLTRYYCENHPSMLERTMKRSDGIPTTEEFQLGFHEISEDLQNELTQCSQDEEIRKPQGKSSKSRFRMRSRASESEMDIGTGTKNVPISCSSNLLESSTKETYHEEQSSRKISSKAEIERSFKSSLPAAAKDPRNKINIPNPSQTMRHLKTAETKGQQELKESLNPLEFPTLDNVITKNVEVAIKDSGKDVRRNSINTPSNGSTPTNNKDQSFSTSSAKKKIKWKAVNINNISNSSNLKDISSTVLVSSADKTLSRDPTNPWKIKNAEKVTFQDIVQEEVEKKENLERAVTKSLHLMQVIMDVLHASIMN
jgi:hypothetical protein